MHKKSYNLKNLLIITLSLSSLVLPYTLFAADYSTTVITQESGTYQHTFDTVRGLSKKSKNHVTIDTKNGEIQLSKDADNNFYSTGKIESNDVLAHQFDYFESASLNADIELPAGTTAKFYLLMIPNGDPTNFSETWQEVILGKDYTLGNFVDATHNKKYNVLRWKVEFTTTNSAISPILKSITINYHNAVPSVYDIDLLHNSFNLNIPSDQLKVTIYGNNFKADKEQVYLEDYLAASKVIYIDKNTLIAEFSVKALKSGNYTMVVRNTDTGRLGLTDGEPLPNTESVTPEQLNQRRLILK